MTAQYPTSLASFVTYQDQPGPLALTLDTAFITNQIHDEVVAVEKTIGVRPWVNTPPSPPAVLQTKTTTTPKPPPKTLGGSVAYLYMNKAGLVHEHVHASLANLLVDAHTQYMPVNASRGFSAPITSPPAAHSNQLVNYSQVDGVGITTTQMQDIINNELAHQNGPPAQSWYSQFKIMGGVAQGYTDANGLLYVPFGSGFRTGVLTFVYMKMPYYLPSYFYGYVYQYEEDQLVLASLTDQGATIQFIEDIQVDRQAWVSMCWIAVGI
jgi:hypothetical protein